MSRSFNDGTPSWAKVETRPEPRRSGELVIRVLKEVAMEEHQRFLDEERERIQYELEMDALDYVGTCYDDDSYDDDLCDDFYDFYDELG